MEKQFGLFLQSRFPDAIIEYESTEYQRKDENELVFRTFPDFHVKKPDGTILIVEITTSKYSEVKDRKEKQRWIMQDDTPDSADYLVLYREDLEEILSKNPDLTFA